MRRKIPPASLPARVLPARVLPARVLPARVLPALVFPALFSLPLVFLAPVPSSAAGPEAEASRRIVAVGDIHGAFEPLRSILLEAGLVDAEENWAGGNAILVQTGDFVDRGAESLRIAQWLMRLQRQAPDQDGEVVVLLGNHEVMNLMGDMRFVTPEMVEPLIDEGSEKRRLEMCKNRAAILRQGSRAMGERPPAASAVRKRCLEEHPLGMVEYYASLRRDQPLGRWLRSLPAVAQVEGTIFLHGGISPELASKSPGEINRAVRQELESFDLWRRWLVEAGRMVDAGSLMAMARAVQVELRIRRDRADEEKSSDDAGEVPDLARFFEMSSSLLLRQDGPFWFRGYDSWTEEEGLEEMPRILEEYGARHVVVGHTPQDPRRIKCRFDGGVFLIDTGMLAEYYKGVPAALELLDGHAEAIYLGARAVLLDDQYSCR